VKARIRGYRNYLTSSAKHAIESSGGIEPRRAASRVGRPSRPANVAIVILWPEAMKRQPYARLPQARIRTCVRRPAVTRRSNNARRNTRLYDNEAPPPKLMPVRCETSRQNRSRYIRHLHIAACNPTSAMPRRVKARIPSSPTRIGLSSLSLHHCCFADCSRDRESTISSYTFESRMNMQKIRITDGQSDMNI